MQIMCMLRIRQSNMYFKQCNVCNRMPMDKGFSTKAIHAGQNPSQWSHCAIVAPIVMSTTFRQDGPAEHRVNSSCIEN